MVERELLSERLSEIERSVGIPEDGNHTAGSLSRNLVNADAKLRRLLPHDAGDLEKQIHCVRSLCTHASLESGSLGATGPSLTTKGTLVASRRSQIEETAKMLEELQVLINYCRPPSTGAYRSQSNFLRRIELKQDSLATKVRDEGFELERLLIRYNVAIEAINAKFLELKTRLEGKKQEDGSTAG